MTMLASDTFQRANASSWETSSGGQVWSAPRGSGSYSIVSDEGVNSANGGSFSVARIGAGTATSTEVLVRLKPADTTSDIGVVARFQDANNFYYGILVNGTLAIGKNVAGTFTTFPGTTFSYSTANFYWLRFNLVGSTLKLKAWQDGTSEPSSWTVTETDSSLSSGGYGLGSDATGSTDFDSLTVTDATLVSLATLAQDTFKVRAALASQSRTTWKIRAALAVLTRSTFKIRAAMSTQTHATWKIRAVLATVARSSFKIRVVLGGLVRALFKIRAVQGIPSRATFKIQSVAVQQVLGVATISDASHGLAAISDVLIDKASSSDVAVGVVTLTDQG